MNLRSAKRNSGISARALWIWGMVFLIAGAVGSSVIQNGILKTSSLTNQQLVDMMEDPNVMGYVTVALILQAIQSCAIPVFAMMTMEGFLRTSDLKKYILRVLGLAVLSEIPYNLVVSGSWLHMNGRNPVFGVVLALVVLYFFRYYAGKSAKNVFIKILVYVMAVLWAEMLGIADAMGLVTVVATFWFMQKKPEYRVFVGAVVMVLCTMFSPYYVIAPVAMMAIHTYNGEPDEGNRWFKYLAYPAMLLAVWGATLYFF